MDPATLIREWLDVTTHGPLQAWNERVTEDIVFRFPYAPPGVSTVHDGYAPSTDAFSRLWKVFDEFTWYDVNVSKIEGEDMYMCTARSRALMVTGESYANNYVILIRLRNGRVCEHIEYFNPSAIVGKEFG